MTITKLIALNRAVLVARRGDIRRAAQIMRVAGFPCRVAKAVLL